MYSLNLLPLVLGASVINAMPAAVKDLSNVNKRDAACGTTTITTTSTVTPTGSSASVATITSTMSHTVTGEKGAGAALTCFSSATVLSGASATTSAPAMPMRKRDDGGYEVFKYIEVVDCSCDGSEVTRNTHFSTSYFASNTPAPSSGSQSGGCSSSTTATTVTVTDSASVVAPTTTTITAHVTSTIAGSGGAQTLAPTPQGMAYYFYANEQYGFTTPGTAFGNVPTLVNGLSNNNNHTHSGTVSDINALRIYSPNDDDTATHFGEDQTLLMPDGFSVHNGNNFGLIFQGYFFAAAGAGKYTIVTPFDTFDDTGLVWLGTKALANNWNYDNADFVMTLFKQPRPGQEVSVTLEAGEAMPVTLFFANVDGPGFIAFDVITPDGQQHHSVGQFFVGGCGGGGLNP